MAYLTDTYIRHSACDAFTQSQSMGYVRQLDINENQKSQYAWYNINACYVQCMTASCLHLYITWRHCCQYISKSKLVKDNEKGGHELFIEEKLFACRTPRRAY